MNDLTPVKFGKKAGIGSAAERLEDNRFLTGKGFYPSDHTPDNALYGFIVRSNHAHARFSVTNLEDVKAIDGVHLVLVHEDIKHLGLLPCLVGLGETEDGQAYEMPPCPILAKDIVRYVGDPIAFIIAETQEIAEQASENLIIDYEALEPVLGIQQAVEAQHTVWPDLGQENRAAQSSSGDKLSCEKAFENCDHVVELEVVNNRLVCNYMETRSAVADYDEKEDLITITLGSQGVHSIQTLLADKLLKIDKSKIRVVTPDVGGGFGTKNFMYHEYPLTAFAAKKLKRAVKWVASRSDHFVSDVHGRDNLTKARMGLNKEGRILALDVDIKADMGAYLSEYSVLIPWFGASMATGLYDIPALYASVTCYYTNTVPVDAYRGAGRPEAAYLIERLINYAALKLDMEANELRRKNFIKPEQFPYKTAAGRLIDVGGFEGHLDRALEISNWDDFEKRRAESAEKGQLRGLGLATYIEACAFAGAEPADLNLNKDGTVTLKIGTQSTGQGHETAYAQFISEELDLPLENIIVEQGDTSTLARGGGTGGSRSIPIGGVSVQKAAYQLAENIKKAASDELEASQDDIELESGVAKIVGTDRALSFADLAKRGDASFHVIEEVKQNEATYPNGTHVCELEIDPETGKVTIEAYTIVDDFGVTVNPLLLKGQVLGGVVQGIGQALYEETCYDESGQLLTASFMDYAMPKADHVPNFHFETKNVPSTTNALGIKGAGEAGSIGSCPAVMNAVIDALHNEYGIEHIDMPATQHKIWSLIKAHS